MHYFGKIVHFFCTIPKKCIFLQYFGEIVHFSALFQQKIMHFFCIISTKNSAFFPHYFEKIMHFLSIIIFTLHSSETMPYLFKIMQKNTLFVQTSAVFFSLEIVQKIALFIPDAFKIFAKCVEK